jgi:arginyl-tRNA synthetase
VKKQIKKLISDTLKKIKIPTDNFLIELDRPKHIKYGDFSCNIALQISKTMKKNPREIGALIIEQFEESDFIEKIEIAGPGFINFYLNNYGRNSVIQEVLADQENYGKNRNGGNQKLQVEFVSANPTGPLHIGHGRGAAIGDSLARIMEANGWKVTREFYYNDAGQQIENLALSVQARGKGIQTDDASFPTDGYRGEYILEIANAYMSQSEIKLGEKTIKATGDLEDINNIRLFSVAFLRNEQNIDLEAFFTFFDEYTLESKFYKNNSIEKIISNLKKNKFTYEKDDALWLKTTEFGDDKDRVMKKSDGSFTYFIPDIAYHLNKWERGFVRVINEQGADHHSTITRVRAGLQGLKKGIPSDWPEYVLHQMVTVTKDGQEVKISKRAGSYITLRDLIDEVGCDATRFFLIARKPDSQLIFDINLAKSKTNENPVYYIQYAHARICAVLEEANIDVNELNKFDSNLLTNEHELQLVKRISEFPEIIELSGNEKSPHYIASFLKDLAGDFHSYYNNSRFLDPNNNLKKARIALIYGTKIILKNGLSLLGLTSPNRM